VAHTGCQPSLRRVPATAITLAIHIREFQETISAAIPLEISSRNSRIAALQNRWDRLRAGLDLILDQRGADMADVPGGASGLLCQAYKGKNAARLVTRIDPGVFSLVAELRAPRAPVTATTIS
jgi:hypothetical protein